MSRSNRLTSDESNKLISNTQAHARAEVKLQPHGKFRITNSIVLIKSGALFDLAHLNLSWTRAKKREFFLDDD